MACIGIITCSNMTNDLACSSFASLEDSYTGRSRREQTKGVLS